jgi:hypothetical protein
MSTPSDIVVIEDISQLDLTGIVFPESAHVDKLMINTNQSLDGIILPESLHTLILGDQVSNYNFKLPVSLYVLICDTQVDPILRGMTFHEGLQELIFNGNVLVDLSEVVLPESIRTLKLGSPNRASIRCPKEIARLNSRLEKNNTSVVAWSPGLNSSPIYDNLMVFDFSRITHLTIGIEHNCCWDQKHVSLCELDLLCVQELTLGECFSQDIQNVKFRDINIIYDYSCSININSCAFPSTLRKIICYVFGGSGFAGDYIHEELSSHIVYERQDRHNGQHTKAALHMKSMNL